MDGKFLKEKLLKTDYTLTHIAARMGVSSQALNSTFNASDVKSSTLEKLCDALSLDLSFFYGGTKYAPTQVRADHGSIAAGVGSRIQGNTTTSSVTNNYGETCADGEPSPIVQTLTESVATLTRELETSQEQKSSLIKIIDKLTEK